MQTTQSVMSLFLYKGQKDPSVQFKKGDYGIDGPMLEGIIRYAWTYGNVLRVFFESQEAADKAESLTGWDRWDEDMLCMYTHDQMIQTCVKRADGDSDIIYYADFCIFPADYEGWPNKSRLLPQ